MTEGMQGSLEASTYTEWTCEAFSGNPCDP